MKKHKIICILTILLLLVISSCTQDEFGDDEDGNIDVQTIRTAMSEYVENFGTLTEYQNLYADPQWGETKKLDNCVNGVSYSVPLKNDEEEYSSYLIVTRTDDGSVSYFLLNLPSKYTDIDAYREETEKLLVLKEDTTAVAYIVKNEQDIVTRASASLYRESDELDEDDIGSSGGGNLGFDSGIGSENSPICIGGAEIVAPKSNSTLANYPLTNDYNSNYTQSTGIGNIISSGSRGGSVSGSGNGTTNKTF